MMPRWGASLVLMGLLTAACGSGSETAAEPTSTSSASSTAPASTTTTSLPATSTTASPSTTTTTTPPTTAPPENDPEPAALVVLDPGHNGANGANPDIINSPVDAGGFDKACNTTGSSTDGGITESLINWEVAQVLQAQLTQAGIEVLLTRDSDDGVGPCIDERGRTAANAGADLLVSLHADGAPPELSGFHVIHPGLRPGYTDEIVEPSTELAGQLRDALEAADFVPATYAGQGGLHQRDDMGTLNHAGVPAVMLEAGNLRNAADASLLTSEEGQQQLAEAITAGIMAFLG